MRLSGLAKKRFGAPLANLDERDLRGSGKLRQIVREWCDDQEGRFKEVIYGEDYDMFNKKFKHFHLDVIQDAGLYERTDVNPPIPKDPQN